jgi:hypothetical protein
MAVNQKPTSSDHASSLIQAIPILTIDRPFSLSAPRAGLRPARPPGGSSKLGAVLRLLERTIVSRRVKDADRIAAMATELCKLGSTVEVEEGAGFICVTRPAKHTPNTIKF